MARTNRTLVMVGVLLFGAIALAALGLGIAAIVRSNNESSSSSSSSPPPAVIPAPPIPAPCPIPSPPPPPPPSVPSPTPMISSAEALISSMPTVHVRVGIIGRGIGGEHAAYELTSKGIGNSANKGASGATGIVVIEADSDPMHVCGIIEPVRSLGDSSGVNPNVLGRSNTPSGSPFVSSYRPMTMTTHAMRVNQATQPEMRCLAKELNLTMYGSPWATEYRMSGYRAFNARMECMPNATLSNGYGFTCRDYCSSDPSHVNTRYESDIGCGTNWGSADLPAQSSSTGQTAFNLWNYIPENNYNQFDYDPEDEWYGWALGYANYYNPTANWSLDGQAYNGASVFPFQPSTPSQDHPRHQCAKFGDLYSMYQYYLGPSYAKFICDVNYGFLGDCYHGIDPCTYIGSSSEPGWTAREYQTVDELYPVGSMTEFCTRQSYLSQHNTNNVPITYYMDEAVLAIEDHVSSCKYFNNNYKKSGYVLVTAKRLFYVDELIISAPPNAIEAMTGSVRDALVAKPQFSAPQNVGVVTITMHWNSSVVNATWSDVIAQASFGSYRIIAPDSCLNRVELLNTPYHRQTGKGRGIRVTYNDNVCIENILALARIADPTLSLYNPTTGFPLNSILVREQLRELKQVFINDRDFAVTFPELAALGNIPAPDFVALDYEENSWFYMAAGAGYTMKQVAQWAVKPLGGNRKTVALNNQAWNMLYSGWALSSVNQTREIMLSMFGAPLFKRVDYEARTLCNPAWTANDWSVVYANPCDPYHLLNEAPNGNATAIFCDISYDYTTPGLDGQVEYVNNLCNEFSPPYAPGQAVVWQGNC